MLGRPAALLLLFASAALAGCGAKDDDVAQVVTASIVNETKSAIWAEGSINSKVDFEGRMVDGPRLRILGRSLEPGQNTTGEGRIPTADLDNINVTVMHPDQTSEAFDLTAWRCKDDPAVSATRLVVSVHDGAVPGSVEMDLWKSC